MMMVKMVMMMDYQVNQITKINDNKMYHDLSSFLCDHSHMQLIVTTDTSELLSASC